MTGDMGNGRHEDNSMEALRSCERATGRGGVYLNTGDCHKGGVIELHLEKFVLALRAKNDVILFSWRWFGNSPVASMS